MKHSAVSHFPSQYSANHNSSSKQHSACAVSEAEAFGSMYARVDRLFAIVMVFQALALVGMAIWLTPKTWSGLESSIHVHVWASISLALLVTFFPFFLALRRPGELGTRLVMAMSQGLVTSLAIHLSGGRIEMHFIVFVSLAFLAMYLDIKVLIAATVVIMSDHLIRGIYWPQSVYGVNSELILRTIEHSTWVVFEDIVLFFSIHRMRMERFQLMSAVSRINACVQSITGQEIVAGHELEAIDAGLDTIREAMTRMQQSVASVEANSNSLTMRTRQAVLSVSDGVTIAAASKDVMDRLKQSVDEITIMVAEVNSIAEQTRLLSLNATIEAARAAENGRGFGVVARNVKDLAVKSSVAASHISKLAECCNQRVIDSANSTTMMLKQLNEIRDIVSSNDAVISEISNCVIHSALHAQQIAVAFTTRPARRKRVSVTAGYSN